MKITDIKYEKLSVKLKKPFVVAIGVVEHGETIIVKIETDEGITGYGEASPFSPVTGETVESVPIFLELFKKALLGKNPFEIEKAHNIMNAVTVGNTSAKAGIDLALYDIMGKKIGIPVYKLLGGYRDSFANDVTVSIADIDDMVETAKTHAKNGFGIIKIKGGINPDSDIEIARRIREAVGEKIKLRVDANQGWDVNTAIRVMDAYLSSGVEAVEQPLKYWDIDGLATVRARTKISVMADESLHSPQDAMKLAKANAVDIFNIKLMKSGGLYPATQINAIGESSGITCMVGCMFETRIGNAASAALVAAKKNATEADLDSFRHFDEKALITGGFTLQNGIMSMTDKPGLGVEVNF
ncbi:MAG: dipeptide epimerase [Defluviitaleaceae bacterium]|nr:dipeptide epimerase [Defluviitaleaceae bacterium]